MVLNESKTIGEPVMGTKQSKIRKPLLKMLLEIIIGALKNSILTIKIR